MPFNHAIKITIDHTQVPSDQATYAVLVAGTFPFLKSVSNGGYVTSLTGYDIGFFTDTLQQNQLFNYQLVPGTYNPSTGSVELWVLLDDPISSTVDTIFYMYFGDSSITNDNSGYAWPNSVKGVWPFANGTTLDTTDFSQDNWPDSATVVGTVNAGPGHIFGGASFTSPADGLLQDSDSDFDDLYISHTSLGFWLSSNSSPTNARLLSKTDNSTAGFLISLQGTSLVFSFVTASGNRVWTAIGAIPADSSEHRVFFTYTGSTTDGQSGLVLYIDGVVVPWDTYVDASGTFVSDAGNPLQIGGSTYYPGSSGRLDGNLDQVVFINATVSADYVAVDYANQRIGSSFLSYGTLALVAVVNSFEAQPPSFSFPGTTNLTWNTGAGSSVSISGIGSVSTSGSQYLPVGSTTSYTLTAISPDGFGTSITVSVSVSSGGSIPIVFVGDNLNFLNQANALGPFYENGKVYFIQDTAYTGLLYTAGIRATKSKWCQRESDWDDSVGSSTRPSLTYGPPYAMQFVGLGAAEYKTAVKHDVYVAGVITYNPDPTVTPGNPFWPFSALWLYVWRLDLLTDTWTEMLAIRDAIDYYNGVVVSVNKTNGDVHVVYSQYPSASSQQAILVDLVYSQTLGWLPSVLVDLIDDSTLFEQEHFLVPEQIAVNAGLAYYLYSVVDLSDNVTNYLVKGPTTTVGLIDPSGTTSNYLPHAISKPIIFKGKWYFTMPSSSDSTATMVLLSIIPGVGPTIVNRVGTGIPVATYISGFAATAEYGANSQFMVLNGKLAVVWRSGPYVSFPASNTDYYVAPVDPVTLAVGTAQLYTQNNNGDGTGTRVGAANHLMPYLIPGTGRFDIAFKPDQMSTMTNSTGLLAPFLIVLENYVASGGNLVGKGNYIV